MKNFKKCPLIDVVCKKIFEKDENDDCVGCTPMVINGRFANYTLRVPDRKEALFFFRNILGMEVLRHEEFASGCGPACRGFCGTLWSKTMVGYGPEDKYFAFELVYSYTKEKYDLGNAVCSITIKGCECLKQAAKNNWAVTEGNVLTSPGGYKFIILQEPLPRHYDPIQKITLYSSNLKRTIKYWNGILGMNICSLDHKKKLCGFCYAENTTMIEFQEKNGAINAGDRCARLSFTCPVSQLSKIERSVTYSRNTIISPLMNVKANGRVVYHVITLGDPDGHEICFYDEFSYKKMSRYNPEAKTILNRYIALESGSSPRRSPSQQGEKSEPDKRSIEIKTDPTEVAPGDTQTPSGFEGEQKRDPTEVEEKKSTGITTDSTEVAPQNTQTTPPPTPISTDLNLEMQPDKKGVSSAGSIVEPLKIEEDAQPSGEKITEPEKPASATEIAQNQEDPSQPTKLTQGNASTIPLAGDDFLRKQDSSTLENENLTNDENKSEGSKDSSQKKPDTSGDSQKTDETPSQTYTDYETESEKKPIKKTSVQIRTPLSGSLETEQTGNTSQSASSWTTPGSFEFDQKEPDENKQEEPIEDTQNAPNPFASEQSVNKSVESVQKESAENDQKVEEDNQKAPNPFAALVKQKSTSKQSVNKSVESVQKELVENDQKVEEDNQKAPNPFAALVKQKSTSKQSVNGSFRSASTESQKKKKEG